MVGYTMPNLGSLCCSKVQSAAWPNLELNSSYPFRMNIFIGILQVHMLAYDLKRHDCALVFCMVHIYYSSKFRGLKVS